MVLIERGNFMSKVIYLVVVLIMTTSVSGAEFNVGEIYDEMFAKENIILTNSTPARRLNIAKTYGAWLFSNLVFITNHENGHADEAGFGNEMTINFGLFSCSGLVYSPVGDEEHELDVATAGFRASNKLSHNAISWLERGHNDQFGEQALALITLKTMFDFPGYVACNRTGESSDIAHIQEILNVDDNYFNKRAIGVVLLNLINIKDLIRAAMGKGFTKRDFRILADCDGETFRVGGTWTY